METNSHATRPAGKCLGWLALCIAAGVLGTVIWPAYLLLPALWAAAMLRVRPQWLALFAAVMLGTAYLLFGDWLMALCLTALAALPALAVCIMQKRRMGNVYTAAAMAGLSLLALYGLVCLPGVISGEGAFAPVQNLFSAAIADTKQTMALLPGLPESLLTNWENYIDLFENTLPCLIVPALCAIACVLALSNLLFFRLFVRKCDFGLAKLRPFGDWGIPRGLTGGLFLMLMAALIVSFTEWEFAAGFSATVNVIVGFPLVVQGLSTLDFFMQRTRRPATARTLVYIGVGLLFSILQSPLMLLGCCEQIFRLRERFRAAGAQRPTL